MIVNPNMLAQRVSKPLYASDINGEIIKPNIPTIHNAINTISNIWLCVSIQFLALYGKKPLSIFDPSRGGSGIKLNIPNPKLIVTIDVKIKYTIFPT